jgi:heterodisulfide reductase subunit C
MMEAAREIQLEKRMDLDFLEEVHKIPGGEKIADCIQCGTCSGSCPVSYMMDYAPRKLFAMIRAGFKEEVLKSDTIWLCASCYLCAARCPKDIKITDIMYALKRISIRDKKNTEGKNAAQLSKSFVWLVNMFGRSHEPLLVTHLFMRTNPMALLGNIPVALKLLMHGRLPMFPKRIKNIKEIRNIIKKVESRGGF